MNEWIDVQINPPPMKKPILVTDGKEAITCMLQKDELGKTVMLEYGLMGWEYEFDFDVPDITHWQKIIMPDRCEL